MSYVINLSCHGTMYALHVLNEGNIKLFSSYAFLTPALTPALKSKSVSVSYLK